MVESDQPAGTVVQVFQKGYLLNDRVLRPALVAVAKAADGGAAAIRRDSRRCQASMRLNPIGKNPILRS